MKKMITMIALAGMLGGCATSATISQKMGKGEWEDPIVEDSKLLGKDAWKVEAPANGTIHVAVYNFRDLTGQRKSITNVASLSSAVTQGADAYLVKALQDVGNGKWFTVVERGGIDNLIKERQMIRQMREMYQARMPNHCLP